MTTTQDIDLHLIRTKLAPPRIGSAPVIRDELLTQLDAQRACRLSLVLGPAGCGKTTLLTQWRRTLLLKGSRVAWYNVGADDDDVHVAAYLVESLHQAGIDIDRTALQLFARSGGKVWKPLLASLINDLGRSADDVYLVVDDFHYLRSFGLLRLVDQWIALAPERFHLVLGSRMRPPLDLGALRVAGQLTELAFGDLRFGLDETQRFVASQGLA
ncbi:MAG: AAA family ATPase, partial [Gammaproteobacteria bacterium]